MSNHSKVKYNIEKLDDFTLVEFEIDGGVLNPEDLAGAVSDFPDIDNSKGVCLSGRGPVWLFSALTHKNHPSTFVSTFDPRVKGCIVTSTHTEKFEIGDILNLENPT